MEDLVYKRVVLKLSGEALAGKLGQGLDLSVLNRVSRELKQVRDRGVQVCVVVGGGNIWRGTQGSAQGMDRSTADPPCPGAPRPG